MLYYGTISKVIPPNSIQNTSKLQYEYGVTVSVSYANQMPLFNVRRLDEFGQLDSYNDLVLQIGQLVCIFAPMGDWSQAVIMGAARNTTHSMDSDAGVYWSRRFNAVTETIDQNGNWIRKLDQGDNIRLNKQFIQLDNSTGESIKIDKGSKTITVNAGADWTMQLGGNMNVTASGNVTIQCAQATVNTSGDAAIKAGGNATVDASSIHLNGSGGRILTDQTDKLVDLITGIPTVGVSTVKAG